MAILSAGKKSRGKKNLTPLHQRKLHIKRGDTVIVTAGKDKGKTGTVKLVFTGRDKALVDGINMVKKAVKPNPMTGERGGIVPREAAIHVSNLMLYSTKDTAAVSRPKTETVKSDTGAVKRVRASRKTGEQFD